MASRAVTLSMVTVGLGLNLRAWILLSPHLQERFDVTPSDHLLLMGLPILVAALVRLPVGVLTDRYGVRVMVPAVSLAAAVAALAVALADSLTALVVAGSAAGVGGAALVVGATLVSRVFPYGQRGMALGVLCLGTVVCIGISAVSRTIDPVGRGAALVLSGLLVGFAGLAAWVFRDQAGTAGAGSLIRRCVEMTRQAAATSLTLLYALALGGVMAIALFLPVYLVAVFQLEWFRALVVAGVVALMAAVARLFGAWWTDRRPTARLLMTCYATAGGLCLVLALVPGSWWLTVPTIAVMAVCDGMAGGALLALIGKAARADSVGAVMGVTGAAAALGALLPPLLVAGVDHLSRSYSTGWLLLAAMLLAVALYVRAYGLRIGVGLAIPAEPQPHPTRTIAIAMESQMPWGAAAIVARLAELAASDNLVVVYGSDGPRRRRHRPPVDVLVAGLRDQLPEHSVVSVRAAVHAVALKRLVPLIGQLIEGGTVAIAVIPVADLRGLTAQLSRTLNADRVLALSYTLAEGAGLEEVWSRSSVVPSRRTAPRGLPAAKPHTVEG